MNSNAPSDTQSSEGTMSPLPDIHQPGGSVGIDFVNSMGSMGSHTKSDDMNGMKTNDAFNRVTGGSDNVSRTGGM